MGREAGESANGRTTGEVWAVRLGLGFLVFGLACRLFVYWLSFPIWRDEAALALNFVHRDFRGLLSELDNFQIAPLLFLWIEKAVYQWLGGSAGWLRLIPFLAGASALVLFWDLARRCLEPLPAAMALGILAVAQSPIQLASTIKPYSLDLLSATLLVTLAVRYLQSPQRYESLAALALAAPFAVVLSYPAIFVVGAVSLVLLPKVWTQGGRWNRSYFLAFNVLGIGVFLLHLRLVGNAGHDPALPVVRDFMAGYWQGGFLPRQPVSAFAWLIRSHVGHLFSYPLPFNGGGLVGLLFVLLGCRALYRQRRFEVLALCLLPFVLNFVAGAMHRYPYAGDQRIEQHLAPSICLLLGSGLADAVRRLTARIELAAVGLAAAFVSIGLADATFDALHPYHDNEAAWARDVAQFVRTQLREGDRIVLPHEDFFTLTCLRWQLLPFADRVAHTKNLASPPFLCANGRVWLLDQMLDLTVVPDEPLARDPLELLSRQARKHWRAIDRTRILTRQAVSKNDRAGYYFCCDLHVLEPSP